MIARPTFCSVIFARGRQSHVWQHFGITALVTIHQVTPRTRTHSFVWRGRLIIFEPLSEVQSHLYEGLASRSLPGLTWRVVTVGGLACSVVRYRGTASFPSVLAGHDCIRSRARISSLRWGYVSQPRCRTGEHGPRTSRVLFRVCSTSMENTSGHPDG
ncbi:hypothetical protein EDB83DRAFT_447669 [Lactarius deliciosus]|nr:hypothetical protein EDB83DRAFT_447669 [Lactarius deliciosus]